MFLCSLSETCYLLYLIVQEVFPEGVLVHQKKNLLAQIAFLVDRMRKKQGVVCFLVLYCQIAQIVRTAQIGLFDFLVDLLMYLPIDFLEMNFVIVGFRFDCLYFDFDYFL